MASLPALGYGNITGHELHLSDVVRILSNPRSLEQHPTMLLVHDRGTKDGDEARLRDLGVDVNSAFWHVLDTQTLAGDWKPAAKGTKWSLARMVSEVCGLTPMTNQVELGGGQNSRPIHHNAQDDAYVTLLAFMSLIERQARSSGVVMKSNPSIRLVSIDFEGSMGVTTEIGVAVLETGDIRDKDWMESIQTNHIIVSEYETAAPITRHKRAS